MNILGERMKTRKQQLELTYKQLSKMLYLSPGAIQSWMLGETLPRVEMIPEICKALKCTPNYLFGFTEAING